MEAPKAAKNLKLALVGLDPPIAISDFDNYTGTLVIPVAECGLREGAILTNDGKALWGGIVRINEDGSFDLCVSPAAAAVKDEVIPWKDLPPFFTVFDGGYESLGQEGVNTLLDDLITFHDLVKVRCHFELNGKQESITGKWGDQENLKTLSEILIDWNFKEKLVPEQLLLLEVELFETVYFVIAINEESDNEGVVLSLTSHFYQQRNRIGRRIPIEPVEIDGLKILEVSDFGMKVSSQVIPSSEASELKIEINDYQLSFGITYRRMVSPEEIQMGLFIQDHSPEARKVWQGFLLKHQYPLLRYRDTHDYKNLFKLYQDTGYIDEELELLIKKFQKKMIDEWTNVDSVGPSLGASIIGVDENVPVCTIGVTKAMGKLWSAQAAAAINNPKFLPFTRSMYSWRTRFILQQNDATHHIAFFLKDKPFLNRFFRKFLITRNKDERDLIVWEEWFHNTAIQDDEVKIKSNAISKDQKALETITRGSIQVSSFIKILGESTEVVQNKNHLIVVRGRPFIHIAQYFNCIFLNSSSSLDISFSEFFEIPAFVILSEEPLTKEQQEQLTSKGFSVLGGYEEVTWACPYALLPSFLQNSLKSLEQMVKKYDDKRVA